MTLPFKSLEAANERLRELCATNRMNYTPQTRLTVANCAISAIEQGKLAWAATMLVHNTAVSLEEVTNL